MAHDGMGVLVEPVSLGGGGVCLGDLVLTMGYIIRVVRKGTNETQWVCCCWLWLLFCMWSNAWMLCFALLCIQAFFVFWVSWVLTTLPMPFCNNNNKNNNTYLILVISLYFPTNLLPLTLFFFLSVHLFTTHFFDPHVITSPTFLTLDS